MVIILIVILFIISIALRLISSGVGTVAKVNKRINNRVTRKVDRFVEKHSKRKASKFGGKTLNHAVNKTANLANTVVTKSAKTVIFVIRQVVDWTRRLLIAILPVILILDIIVLVVLVSSTTVVLLLTNEDADLGIKQEVNQRDTDNTVEEDYLNIITDDYLFFGDSRVMQMAMGCYDVEQNSSESKGFEANDGSAEALAVALPAESDDTHYFISNGGRGIVWAKKIDLNTYGEGKNVIYMLGANDSFNTSKCQDHIDYINSLAENTKLNVFFVPVLSIGPIKTESTLTNEQIEAFNDVVLDGLSDNVVILDIYEWAKGVIDADSQNGLHYTTDTYQQIHDKIVGLVKEYQSKKESGGTKQYNEGDPLKTKDDYEAYFKTITETYTKEEVVQALMDKYGMTERYAKYMIGTTARENSADPYYCYAWACVYVYYWNLQGEGYMTTSENWGSWYSYDTVISNGYNVVDDVVLKCVMLTVTNYDDRIREVNGMYGIDASDHQNPTGKIGTDFYDLQYDNRDTFPEYSQAGYENSQGQVWVEKGTGEPYSVSWR